ncbi:MAG: T9SS type A sorting domain-containing protein, partial [Bacteroidia bacterium]|nr:T9SS type A sorting domain-containing protein [Bacteroidia bacterium]
VADASICSGTSTLLTATGANTYQWMPGNLSGGSQNLNPLSTSIYTITGSIGSCTSAITTTVNVTTTPTISAANASICPGASAVINASGAASYTWTPGNLNGSSQTLSPTSTTNYTIVGTNGNCSDSKTISVHVYTVFQAFGIATPATICYGQSSNLVAGGGTTYTWTAAGYTANGSMPPPVNPTVTTIYNLAGFDGTCVTTNTVLIVVNPLPTLTVPGATICNGTTATITASGATNYTWTPGNLYGGSQTFTPSSTTTYTVKGEYTTGCSSTNNFTITVNPLPVVSINSSTSSLCSGQSATLTATSGLTYNWSHGLGTINPVAVSPGSNTQYTVSASDGTCVSTAVTSVSVNPTPNLSAGNASMCINASQNMTVSGANNYTWMPGSLTGSSIVVNPAGTTIYTVTGENTFGCKTSVNATLTVLQLPVFSTTVLNTVCTPGNGTVLTSATLNYTANLPGTVNGSTLILTPTVTGVYTVTGSDGFCSSTSTIYFTVSSPPVLTVAPTGSACSNASYHLNASGAGAGSYTWMPGNLNNLTSVLVQSNTVFTVTGANPLGCQSTATQSVFVTPSPTMIPGALSYSVCPGESLTLTASGSTAFTTWNPGNINGQSIVITPALSGTTIYTVSGNNGLCWSTATTVVNVFPSPTISISGALSGSMCSGTSLTLTGNGADIYSWSPSGTNNSSINITAGNTSTLISLSGTINATGCKTTETLNINVSQSPTLTASANPTLVCAGQSSTLIASGALNYLWSPGAVANYSISVTPTNNTTYYVYGAIGSCTAMLPVSVAWSPVPILSASASPTNVCSGQSATLTMASTNGTAYIWNPGNINNQAITVIPQGNTIYTATTFDSNGCSSTKTVAINVAPNPTITYSTNPSVICEGRTTTLTAMGATNYTWSLSGTAGPSLLIVPGPIYTDMIIGEQGGCVSYLQFNLGALPPPLVNIAPVPMTACEGATLPLTAFGGITYTWQPGNLIGSPIVVTPTASTIYSVTGTGTNGCSSQKTISINTIPPPVISVEGIKDFFCEGETALLQGMGASSYTWMPLNLITASISVTPSSSSIYTLVGMKFGCVSQLQFTVTVEDCTGLKDAPESKDTRIFPNPFNSEFVINFGDAFSGNVALYNALGQLISEHQVYNRRELKIIVPEIAKGIYLLQITSYDTESVKIVKLLKD